MKGMSRSRYRWDIALTVLLIVLEIAGCLLAFRSHQLDMFRWYTIDSNILMGIAAVCWLTGLIGMKKGRPISPALARLKFTATCCVTLTFLVVLFILMPSYGFSSWRWIWFAGSSLFLHLLCPLLAVFTFVTAERSLHLTKKDVLHAIIPTAIYGLIILCGYWLNRWDPPYPFMDTRKNGAVMTVVWLLVLFGLNAGLAAGLRRLNRGKSGAGAG